MGVNGEVDLAADYDYALHQAALETRRFVVQAKRVIEYINDGSTPADIPVTVEVIVGATTYRLPLVIEYGTLIDAINQSIEKSKAEMMKRIDPNHES